jgi:Flp pilus assembly protein TadG
MHPSSGPAGRFRHPEAGAALIEFALVLVPLLALIFLMVDTAWVIYAKASLQEAVREGVRFGVTGGEQTCSGSLNACIRQVVQQYSAGFVNANNVASAVNIRYTSPSDSTTPLTGCGATSAGNILQITISGVAVVPMAPLLRSNSPLSLGASAADAMEANASTCP